MRRFFIWSALAALIGLILAGGGYWAYWNYYARFQPVVITTRQAEIQRLLDEASWVSDGSGGEPLYIIGYRASAAMQRYEHEEAPKLRAAGVEVRSIVFARPDLEGLAQSTASERATVAELWLTRDWTLYQRWTATPADAWSAAGIPVADGNLARAAVVEAGRAFATHLSAALRSSGLKTRYPLVVWRDREGFMKACACDDARSWAFIRDDLDAPDRVTLAAPTADGGAVPPEAGDGAAQSLPYPALPPLPTDTPPADAANPAGTPPRPATRTTPRPPPKAKQQEDATFF
ncbi:hypothetical protein [uncultured Brevundimonas sp.]|uniref:hypothetical protein n=1 Tax=uncultured Brevundimonas sp. TaxID=213418 RepID=UPI0030ED51E9|tara:strand:- start:7851 stop:8720 length:870 start_codon:yes stop_codon:yes gene_type:complete